MDFLSKKDEPKPTSGDPKKPENDLRPSKSDLIHSAKVVADAAQAHLRREPEKYDKAEVADATADLLNAAAEYGKLDDNKGIGMYIDKAEDYLRQYHNPQVTGHGGESAAHKQTKSEGHGSEYSDGHKPTKSEGHSGGGGGAGDFVKMAGDFLKK